MSRAGILFECKSGTLHRVHELRTKLTDLTANLCGDHGEVGKEQARGGVRCAVARCGPQRFGEGADASNEELQLRTGSVRRGPGVRTGEPKLGEQRTEVVGRRRAVSHEVMIAHAMRKAIR